MAYATIAELTTFYGSAPANAQLLLDRASRDVDQALLCQFYDPTLAANIAALNLATLEQVAGNLDAGVKKGNGAIAPDSFTLGKLSVTRSKGGANPATRAVKIGRLWEQAYLVLQSAKLTGQGPRTI